MILAQLWQQPEAQVCNSNTALSEEVLPKYLVNIRHRVDIDSCTG